MTAPWREICKYCGTELFMTLGYLLPGNDIRAVIDHRMEPHYATCPDNPENNNAT